MQIPKAKSAHTHQNMAMLVFLQVTAFTNLFATHTSIHKFLVVSSAGVECQTEIYVYSRITIHSSQSLPSVDAYKFFLLVLFLNDQTQSLTVTCKQLTLTSDNGVLNDIMFSFLIGFPIGLYSLHLYEIHVCKVVPVRLTMNLAYITYIT